jgi:cell fate regulator YaaT (PSP1 superfamily)
MACAGCTTHSGEGTPVGCRSNGNCSTGGCNRMNSFDWLTRLEVEDVEPSHLVEISFKNGSRKGIYMNPPHTHSITGDQVVVEAKGGYDIGRITLSGELVRLQMRKKKIREDQVIHSVLRKANERDLEKLEEARALERSTMVRARVIARTLGLEMKIGDVEYQGDKRKATFFYTAEGRVDFRELIRHYAREFRVKIEMRQIGARQESARIGGLGSCGRELCCSTWLSDFKSVSTSAARYQNLAINQAKLSGQCGRLKCCLNYELDTYMEALDEIPKNVDRLKTLAGTAVLVKTDIFKKLMYFAYQKEGMRGKTYTLEVDRVKEIKVMNEQGEFPTDLVDLQLLAEEPEKEMDFESVNDVIELPPEERRKKRRKKRNPRRTKGGNSKTSNQQKGGKGPDSSKGGKKSSDKSGGRNRRRKKGPRRDNKGPKKDS